MTNTSKPVKRETFSSARDRNRSLPLIIELHSTYLKIKLKGKRYAYTVTYDQVWNIGAKNAAAQLKQAKLEAKKTRLAH